MELRPSPSASEPSKPDFFSSQVSQARRFYLNLRPDARNGLVVVCGGVEHCVPGYVINRKSFPFYSIEYVASGIGRLKLEQREYLLQPGSVFSYGPNVHHTIATDPQRPLVKYFVDFAGSAARELLGNCRMRAGSMSQVFPPRELQPLFDELIRNGLRGVSRKTPRLCATLLEALFMKITESRAPLPGRETLAFGTYQHCLNHIQRDFKRLGSVAQVARECHLNNSYLCRLFKRYHQESPYHCLLRLKMNYAAERLRSPDILIKHVAEETGFANQFHFSRAFKAVFGIPPSALSRMR
jgi:AraC-like DNA-binding protein/quercetin dioxygenase-like cupin family protein